MEQIGKRREFTIGKIKKLKKHLSRSDNFLGSNACVYSTGSFGRHEAGENSDLDVFIVSRPISICNGSSIEQASALRLLDEICLKAALIKATKELSIKEFDGDGRYLVHYTTHDLIANLGSPDDDAANTFTARLLLLLESAPLAGEEVYGAIIDDVIGAYWKDYNDHKHNFVPAFLANDILRLWRTFCVNYEARTNSDTTEKNIKRRQKNYTLKHSRLLTCFSGLLFLLATFKINKTVRPDDVKRMVSLSPTGRLEWMLREGKLSDASNEISDILERYERFLVAKSDDNKFRQMFETSEDTKQNMADAQAFSESVFIAINKIGENNIFHRLLLV